MPTSYVSIFSPPRRFRARQRPSKAWIPTSKIFGRALPTLLTSRDYLRFQCRADLRGANFRWDSRSSLSHFKKLRRFGSPILMNRPPLGTNEDQYCNDNGNSLSLTAKRFGYRASFSNSRKYISAKAGSIVFAAAISVAMEGLSRSRALMAKPRTSC